MHVRQRRLREVDDFRELDDFRAVARPPFAPAVRTDMVPRPRVRDDADDRLELVFRAVARPPFAPAAFFCARVPARPPRAPAARTLIVLRPVRDVVLRRLVVLRLAVFRDVVLRADVLRADVLRADVLRADVLRADVLRADVLRADVALRRLDEVVPPDERDELDELRPRDDDDPPLFASPDFARCLFTVLAAISFARDGERPCFFSDSSMCSYWRSRFELHDL